MALSKCFCSKQILQFLMDQRTEFLGSVWIRPVILSLQFLVSMKVKMVPKHYVGKNDFIMRRCRTKRAFEYNYSNQS